METCPDCGDEYQRINQHFAMSSCGSDDGAKETYVCDLEGCSESFKDYPTRLETRGREDFYCCKDHKYKAEKNGKVVHCAWCGSEVYKAACQLQEMGDYAIDNHFCDKDCEKQFKQQNWVRDGHPLWEGGKAGVDTVRNCLSEFSWYRIAEWAREDECENCGDTGDGRRLDVHHIIPVSAGGTNHPDNLITLCISCHRKGEAYTKKFVEPHLLKPAL